MNRSHQFQDGSYALSANIKQDWVSTQQQKFPLKKAWRQPLRIKNVEVNQNLARMILLIIKSFLDFVTNVFLYLILYQFL